MVGTDHADDGLPDFSKIDVMHLWTWFSPDQKQRFLESLQNRTESTHEESTQKLTTANVQESRASHNGHVSEASKSTNQAPAKSLGLQQTEQTSQQAKASIAVELPAASDTVRQKDKPAELAAPIAASVSSTRQDIFKAMKPQAAVQSTGLNASTNTQPQSTMPKIPKTRLKPTEEHSDPMNFSTAKHALQSGAHLKAADSAEESASRRYVIIGEHIHRTRYHPEKQSIDTTMSRDFSKLSLHDDDALETEPTTIFKRTSTVPSTANPSALKPPTAPKSAAAAMDSTGMASKSGTSSSGFANSNPFGSGKSRSRPPGPTLPAFLRGAASGKVDHGAAARAQYGG